MLLSDLSNLRDWQVAHVFFWDRPNVRRFKWAVNSALLILEINTSSSVCAQRWRTPEQPPPAADSDGEEVCFQRGDGRPVTTNGIPSVAILISNHDEAVFKLKLLLFPLSQSFPSHTQSTQYVMFCLVLLLHVCCLAVWMNSLSNVKAFFGYSVDLEHIQHSFPL